MRLITYLSYSGLDEKTNTFRSLDIKLIDKPEDYSDILEHVQRKYQVECKENILENLNKELRKVYKGKFSFALCLEEGVRLDEIKINKKHIKRIKLLQFESSDKLSHQKTEVERKSKRSYTKQSAN